MAMTDRPILVIREDAVIAQQHLRAGRTELAERYLARTIQALDLADARDAATAAIWRTGLVSPHTQRVIARARRAEEESLRGP